MASHCIVLYGFIASPPLRACMLTCEALGIKYILKDIDVTRMEHHKPEYLKLNPIHSIPTMVDGDYVLFDSHAISAYLANVYEKEDKWYPKEPRLRGIVDQRLHFDCSVLGPSMKGIGVSLLFGKTPTPSSIDAVSQSMKQLDILLGDKQFLAHDRPTIADCHGSATVVSIKALLPETVTERIENWLQRCKQSLPGFDKVNDEAVKLASSMRSAIKSTL